MTDKSIDRIIDDFALNEKFKGFKSETVKIKVRDVERLNQYLKEQREDMTLLSLTEEKLKEYLNTFAERMLLTTYNRSLSNIRMFYKYLKDEEVILINPALAIPGVKVMEELHFRLFTEDEVSTILDVIPGTLTGKRDRAILELFYSSALRINELVRLDEGDIDLRSHEVIVRYGKNDRQRVVPVGETAVKALHDYLDIRTRFMNVKYEEALFLSLKGRRIDKSGVNTRIRMYKKISGVKSRGASHAFRHACASHMLKNGAPMPVIQQLLGHSKLLTTVKYTHVMKDDLKNVHKMSHPKADARE